MTLDSGKSCVNFRRVIYIFDISFMLVMVTPWIHLNLIVQKAEFNPLLYIHNSAINLVKSHRKVHTFHRDVEAGPKVCDGMTRDRIRVTQRIA